MLVLNRKKNEEIVIGDNKIIIRVLDIRDGIVRLGFQADDGVIVHRREVFEAIKRKGVDIHVEDRERRYKQDSSTGETGTVEE